VKRASDVKTLKDDRTMLNLGCGTKMDWGWNNLDFSLYVRLARHKALARILKKIRLLSEPRYHILQGIDPEMICWDLSKGIPFESNTFDVVYNSHLLEHIKRALVPSFLKECHRVLKPNGVVRIVVPDLAVVGNLYTSSLSRLQTGDDSELENHLAVINELFEQMVRQDPVGTSQQSPLVRRLERLIRGNACETGESHRWMYDEYSLGALLSNVGFKDIQGTDYSTSRIDGWAQFGLDVNEDGAVYKPGSLYMEAIK